MEFIWVLFAFFCGLGAKLISLPPSIGYLLAGFVLHFMGFEADDYLTTLADLGITLMLFTIGLKLNVKDLLKLEVWGGALSHTALWLVSTVVMIKLVAFAGLTYFAALELEIALLIAFALSFSSTVCIVKLLEEQGEMRTRHGKLAVGILVMQDVVAVAFLVVATGKTPSIWALGLVALFLIKPIMNRIITAVGHGELIPLTGFFLALGSYELFEAVSIKGDLGALIVGMLLASHPKASEINKALLNFKDLFLIGFFLMIGFTALPTWEMLGIALLICLMLPIKFALFYVLLSSLKLKARPAFLSAMLLTNFSEFGLIVAALSVDNGWLSKEWLVILALAVSISFVLTNVVYRFSERLFAKHKATLTQLERTKRLPEDIFDQPCDSPIVVVGMGRVGMGAYQALDQQVGNKVWGLDADRGKIDWLKSTGAQAFYGDAESRDFWETLDLNQLELVMIAVPSVQDVINITTQLKAVNYRGQIAAIARFDDEREELQALGIDKVFNFYNEAGVGFAEESLAMVKVPQPV
ncbi:cation:proton antiporter family protein [Thalassotalea euphylliae]|uniref:Potassium transporter Kef n=1 Tax=Thalassotalea euphylliae TaxID=1655234 RepID=A0A3E0UEL6_9GAMM|nr:cation:proton antiporter family protein [Thalassotalea euphylliae]REL35300.1 potassium transporter Kef [Thalassotalea euphylliae]